MTVTLHLRTEPYEGKDDEDLTFDGNKVIGEVKCGDKILYSKEVITNDTIESVCGVQEHVALAIELWAVTNTDFQPTEDALPA